MGEPDESDARADAPPHGGRRGMVVLGPSVAAVLTALTFVVFDGLRPGADGSSYLALGRYWADGDVVNAVNGYWSPLFPLLLAPFALVGVDLEVAAEILLVAFAALAVFSVERLMGVLGVERTSRTIIALGVAPYAAFASADFHGPDVLMGALLVLVVAETISTTTPWWGVGVLAGASFLAKAYAAPVVVVFLVVAFVVARFAPSGVERSPRSVALAGLVFAGVAGAWVTAISIDEGTPTVTTAGSVNVSLTSPGSVGTPISWAGFLEPEHPDAFTPWEDPARLPTPADRPEITEAIRAGGTGNSPSSGGDGRFERIVDNTIAAARASALAGGSVVAAMVVALVALALLVRGRRSAPSTATQPQRVVVVVIAVAVYVGGLLVLVVNARYLTFAFLCAAAVAAAGLGWLVERGGRRRLLGIVLAVAVAASTAARPAVALYRLGDRSETNLDSDLAYDAITLEGRRVASLQASTGEVGARCLEAGCTYLGAARTDPAAAPIADQLADFDVDVFVVFGRRDVDLGPGARVVDRTDDPAITVWDVSGL